MADTELLEDDKSDKLNPGARAEQKRVEQRFGASSNTNQSGGANERSLWRGPESDSGGKDISNEAIDSKSLSPSAVGKQEANPRDGAGSGNGSEEAGLFSGQEKSRNRFGLRVTRRQGIAGGIIGVLLGGGIFGSLILSGPFELIHLSQILSHNFSKVQSDTEDRTNHFLRDARAWREKDVRYTRVGGIAARLMNRALDQLEAKGLTVTGQDAVGHPTTLELNHEKIKANFPETKGMTAAEIDKWAGNQLGTEPFKDGKLGIGGLKGQAVAKILSNGSIKFLGNGKAMAAVKVRPLKKFFGLGSLFHPFSRATDNALSKAENNAKEKKAKGQPTEDENKAATKALQDEQGKSLTNAEAKADAAFSEYKSEHGGLKDKVIKGVGSAEGLAWVTGCTLKDSGKVITAINRDGHVVPATIQATTLLAAGSQTQYGGSDVTSRQEGAQHDASINDKGQDLWSATAMEAMSGVATKSLDSQNDISEREKAAFADQSFGTDIESVGNKVLDYSGFSTVADITSTLTLGLLSDNPCSLEYAAAVLAAGIATNGAALASCATGCEGEVLTQAVRQLVVHIIHTAESAALTVGTLAIVTHELIDSNTAPKLAEDAFSGPEGGNLVAYGAREAGNMSAIASGGIAITGSNTSTLMASAGEEEQQQFRSESFFAKMFDTSDYRSLTGQISMAIHPNAKSNFMAAVNGMQNIGSSFANVFSSLIPGVSAAGNKNSWSGDYDWGFPQYGIPDNMLNDPHLSDPVGNAETVGQYLSSICSDGGNIDQDTGACGGDGYTKRILTCFGNDLTYTEDPDVGQKVWDVAPASNVDVDPNSSDYQNADCGDVGKDWDSASDSQRNWRRIVMFVNDTSTGKSGDCLVGDSSTSDQSCTDEGLDAADNPSQGGSSPTGSPVAASGTAAEIATELLAKWGNNLTGNQVVKDDLTAISQGQTINNSDTCGNTISIDADLLQVILTTTTKYKLFLDNIVSGHGCDEFLHPKGRASDIGGATDLTTGRSTNFCAPSSNPTYTRDCASSGDNQQLDHDFYVYMASIMPRGSEMGQNTCAGRSGISSPPGIDFFGDGCNHQHIDLGDQ